MLSWLVFFLLIALSADALGFTSVAGAAMTLAQILFFAVPVLLVLALVSRALRTRTS